MDNLDLSQFFSTPVQAGDFKTRLAVIVEKMYQTDFNFEMALLEEFGINKRDQFLIFLRNNKVDVESPKILKEFLNQVIERIGSIQVLAITLAFEPKEQTLEQLSAWFITNLNRQVLFEITVNPAIVAGVAVRMNGNYLDFSVKQQYDQIVKDALKSTPTPAVRYSEFTPAPVVTPKITPVAPPIQSTISTPQPPAHPQTPMPAAPPSQEVPAVQSIIPIKPAQESAQQQTAEKQTTIQTPPASIAPPVTKTELKPEQPPVTNQAQTPISVIPTPASAPPIQQPYNIQQQPMQSASPSHSDNDKATDELKAAPVPEQSIPPSAETTKEINQKQSSPPTTAIQPSAQQTPHEPDQPASVQQQTITQSARAPAPPGQPAAIPQTQSQPATPAQPAPPSTPPSSTEAQPASPQLIAQTVPPLLPKEEHSGGLKWRFFTKIEHKKANEA